jgi:hypothetical protein
MRSHHQCSVHKGASLYQVKYLLLMPDFCMSMVAYATVCVTLMLFEKWNYEHLKTFAVSMCINQQVKGNL